MSFEVESLAASLQAVGVPRDRALAQARIELGVPAAPTWDEIKARDARDEKRIVHEADKQMRALGFVVINFSQPRASKQTAGIPDRRYYHAARGVALWWESKTPSGRQSPGQRQFQEWCDACQDPYVLGTDEALYAWLIAQGIAAEVEGGLLVGLPYTARERSA